jgi:hypothetical protein
MNTLTREQSRRNLVIANDRRSRRSRLKEQLAAGQVTLEHLLSEVPVWAERMRVLDVLVHLPRIYKKKAARALEAARIARDARLGDLTERQVRALLAHFRNRHPGPWALWNAMSNTPAGLEGADGAVAAAVDAGATAPAPAAFESSGTGNGDG